MSAARSLPRVILCLVLVLIPLSLFAAGHDISSVRYAPSDFITGSASVAYNGNHFLTLWPMSFHIYGSLADPSGGTLSPAFAAAPFAKPNGLQLIAAGSGYLAVWNQEGVPTLGTFNSAGVLERGVTLDGDPFVAPRVAFNGTSVLVVDQTGFPTPVVGVSVYGLTGRLVNRFVLPVFGGPYAVTSTGSDFIVVTAGRSGVNEWRIATDGTILSTLQIDPPPAHPVLSLYDVAVTARNGRIAIAWEQQQFETVSSVLIQPDGSVTRSELPTGGLRPLTGVGILPVDIGFFVAWNVQAGVGKTGVFAIRLNDAGASLDARPFDLGDGPFMSAASSGKVVELALSSSPPVRTTTLVVDVNASAISPRTPAQMPVTAVRQLLPAVAGNGSGFTGAWLDLSKDSQRAEAGRVTATGEALDGTGITLGELGQPATPPAIAHGSSGELVVWTANGHLVAARLTPFGTTLDATPIVIAPLSFPASATYSVAWSGSRFFVVWADAGQLFGSFVGLDGIATPPRPPGIQIPPLTLPSEPDVAWDGRQFIVVYGEVSLGGICVEGCVRAADKVCLLRVSADGVAIDTNPVRIPGFHLRAHVASSGTESLIALDSITDTSAMIVRDEGGVLQLGQELPLFHWLNTLGSDVAWTGSLYVVAWRYEFLQMRPGWIGISRIGQSGVPFGSLFSPTAGPAESGTPLSKVSVAANDAGEAAIVISEMAPPTYVARARLYLMSELAPMPAAPRPPRNVVMYGAAPKTVITWQSDGAQDGFVIEASGDSGMNWFPTAVTGDVRSATTSGYPAHYLFRVRAIGPGGFSEPVVATPGRVERRRAERR